MTRYELLDRIGVGGMAEIFRGRALAAGGFEKPVAIKRILPHLCQDQRFVELLIAEAKVLSALRHRNIVQIFDVGLGDDGQYFLVMEFVNGLDLGRIQAALEAKRRILPVDLSLHIGAEVCEALHHAHIANDPDGKPMKLVHRDISPSNVLLSRAGEVKLTDFGIAKRAEEVTGHGTVRGKFAYISPEQARNEHVDPRSDVFSLGIVLFELLTGRRLFSQLSDLDALRAVRESRIPRPRELDGNLPKTVDELLGKALARDPDRRFATAAEFGLALRSLRYAQEATSGDPSSEVARVVASAESPNTIPPGGFEPGEATVIRIRTAEAFSMHDARVAFSNAREVIHRFEEEETRLSKLGPTTLRDLRAGRDDSGAMPVPEAPGAEEPPPPATAASPAPRQLTKAVVARSAARRSSITGDEPTALADPMQQEPELDEETIARPSPLRGMAPITLKRVPPPTGPSGTPAPSPRARGGTASVVPRTAVELGGPAGPVGPAGPLGPPAPGQPGAMPGGMAGGLPGGMPVAMPDAAGWEAPSYSAASYSAPGEPAPLVMRPRTASTGGPLGGQAAPMGPPPPQSG
ncbi:MAG: serine/threonine protein kinase [Myxococcales bacterium]|nr:serine/threonine protein kinase [Myxococcales bacterium]